METLKTWLGGLGVPQPPLVAALLAVAGVVLLGVLVNLIAKRVILRVVGMAVRRTKVTWDDIILERKVFTRLSHLAPALVIYHTGPVALADYPAAASLAETGALVYMVLAGLLVADAALNALLDIYERFEVAKRIPIKVFIQVLKIVLYVLAGIFVLANLLGKSPLVFFSGLGAFTAVLLLIFKDAILGLVAGIQLISNNMVRRGDWIEMPKYGVDGDVLDVSLTTVKVQNWDKTVSTIPTYSLIADSFRNWRGMEESGGRRIKRAVSIDMNSVKFCDEEMLARFKGFQAIREHVERKLEEIADHNREQQVDERFLINGRHLTNVGTFRAYLEAYLRNHPMIHRDLTFLVRHLAPTAQGLPIEIYVFSSDQRWANYEAIQADIFDHILAVIPLFDLRVFQEPTGADLRALATSSRKQEP